VSDGVTVRVDGASRGNPGPAGIGAVVEFEDGRTPLELCSYIGETTNNVAEYRALLLALDEAFKVAPSGRLTVYSDSELLVRQLNGRYKVKAEHLRPLHIEALRMLRLFSSACVMHVAREENRQADLLANLAIDRHYKYNRG